jgi:hypothetical protein
MDYMPRAEGKFLTWINTFLGYLKEKLTAFNFPPEKLKELEDNRDEFAEALAMTEKPATRTSVAVKEKNAARKKLERNTRRAISEYLAKNHVLTDADRETLGLTVYKTTRTPAPVALTYPYYHVDTSMIRRLIVHFRDQKEIASRAKPPGQHGVEVRWAISEAPVVTIKNLVNTAFDTRTPFTLEFSEHERGKKVYFCLCWCNNRGRRGPWSEIVSAIIP